jgi:hypothetical protein
VTVTPPIIPDPPGLAEELCEIVTDLTSLEALMYDDPGRLSAEEQQELKQELDALRTRLKRILQ